MVHKKSEYELQYHRLTNEIRAQIWKENVNFREAQKRNNLSDHYWRYQLIDDACICDNGSAEEDVIKRYGYLDKVDEARKPFLIGQEKAVQTSDWNESISKSHQEQCPTDLSLEQKSCSIIEESVQPVAKANSSENDTTAFHGPSFNSQQISTLREENNKAKEKPKPVTANINPRYDDTSKSSVHWSQFGLSPTRNALKHFLSKSKSDPVFAAFGFNESNIDVGSHKTYNVRAPVDQVHKSALMASGKRLRDLELHLADQLKKKQQQRSQLPIGHANSSSIWMTEYQECFSRGKREPLTRSTFRRPVVWRYT